MPTLGKEPCPDLPDPSMPAHMPSPHDKSNLPILGAPRPPLATENLDIWGIDRAPQPRRNIIGKGIGAVALGVASYWAVTRGVGGDIIDMHFSETLKDAAPSTVLMIGGFATARLVNPNRPWKREAKQELAAAVREDRPIRPDLAPYVSDNARRKVARKREKAIAQGYEMWSSDRWNVPTTRGVELRGIDYNEFDDDGELQDLVKHRGGFLSARQMNDLGTPGYKRRIKTGGYSRGERRSLLKQGRQYGRLNRRQKKYGKKS